MFTAANVCSLKLLQEILLYSKFLIGANKILKLSRQTFYLRICAVSPAGQSLDFKKRIKGIAIMGWTEIS